MVIHINNKTARLLFIHRHGLGLNPAAICTKSDVQSLIEHIGFVQIDSIRTVERAHNLILFSRLQKFKHAMLEDLLEKDHTLFENWTHDASIIPSSFYPYWKHRFAKEKTAIIKRWEKWGRKGFAPLSQQLLEHIHENGPTLARTLKPKDKPNKNKSGWWDWHPSKIALEYLWRTGQTAIAHREGFQKAYDVAEKVLPAQHFKPEVSSDQYIDWVCSSALDRLGFATHSEIAAFWGLISPAQAKHWVEQNSNTLAQAQVTAFDGKTQKEVWARPDILEHSANLAKPSPRIRILSPFDPMLRDRKRAEFLFGFDYRIEVFVPEAKRKYGYYVFPIMRGDKIIGRIDMKADRKNLDLNIRRIWLENGQKWSDNLKSAFDSELNRLARFSGLKNLNYDADAFCP